MFPNNKLAEEFVREKKLTKQALSDKFVPSKEKTEEIWLNVFNRFFSYY
jgi:hypothetical protein